MSNKTLKEKMFCFFTVHALSHITLNPNFGGFSGEYFHTTIRVPHGATGMHTTRLEVDVPHGILVSKPEVPEDWSVDIQTRELAVHERYTSHGVLKTLAPHKLVFSANSHGDGVHDDHLMNIDLQLKIGCIFDNPESNTKWNKEYTLWWPMKQFCEDVNGTQRILGWVGTQSDRDDGTSPSWSALPDGMKPAPYMYIDPGTRCSIDHSGAEKRGGLTWFGAFVREDEVLPATTPSEALQYITLVVSTVSVAMGSISIALIGAMACFRLQNKKRFAERLVGVEYCACKEMASSHNMA